MGGKRQLLEAGQRFGRLTILSDDGHGYAECRCECGAVKRIKKPALSMGRTVSCGCWSRERTTKHGMEASPTYNAWAAMLSRCRNPKNKWFHRYGGRGIRVSDRWQDFRNFLADMGEKPAGMSLDRWPDNDGGYELANCRWASTTEQIRNRNVTLLVEFEGRMIPVAELAERHGLSRRLVASRLARGLSVEEAVAKVRYTRWDGVT